MARLAFGGVEAQHEVPDHAPRGETTAHTIETADPITGGASYRTRSFSRIPIIGAVADRTYFGRIRFRLEGSARGTAVCGFNTSSLYGTRRGVLIDNTTGKMRVQGASSSHKSYPVVEIGAEHVLEISDRYDSANAVNLISYRLDGGPILAYETIGPSGTGLGIPNWFMFGKNAGNTVDPFVVIDDWAVGDDTGSAYNTWIGPRSRIALLKPTSDVAVGNWQKGAGGAGSLWDSVNNVPPTGKRDTGTTGVAGAAAVDGDQIRNGVSAVSSYEAECEAYEDVLPVDAGDLLHARPAAAVGSGGANAFVAQTYDIAIAPDGSSYDTAMTGEGPLSNSGIFPSNWSFGSIRDDTGLHSPLVTPTVSDLTGVAMSDSPKVKLTKNTLTIRQLLCCFLGVVVEYDYDYPEFTSIMLKEDGTFVERTQSVRRDGEFEDVYVDVQGADMGRWGN